MGIDLKSGRFNKPHTNGWFVEQDFIARRSTSCAVAVQGIKPDEDASFTTMWTVIGYPPVTPVVPVWVKGADKKLPDLLITKKDTIHSPLCNAASVLRNKVYGYKQGSNAETYFNWELLFNQSGDGYMQHTGKMEQELFQTIYKRIDEWRKDQSLSTDNIYRLYNDCDTFIVKKFNELYNLNWISSPSRKGI